MRFSTLLLLPCLACLACGAADSGDDTGTATSGETGDATTTPTTGEPGGDLNDRELGADASPACLAAAPKVAELTGAADAAAAAAAYTGALQTYVQALDAANMRADDAEISAWLTDGSPAALAAANARVHVALAAQYRASLAAVEEGAEDRYAAWDEAHCAYTAALRALAEEADGATWHDVSETITADIDGALQTGHDGISGEPPATAIDEWRVLSSKQVAEKSLFRAFHRVIVELAGQQEEVAARRALELFGALEDRLDGRNTPGIQQVKDMLSGDPAAIDAAAIRKELDLAFAKRTRRYCTAAIDDGEVATPTGYKGAVEGITYAKLILPGMLADVAAADAMAYLGEWGAYAELVRTGEDEASLGVVSGRIADQTCAYQTALGVAECTGETDETE
ncbi:MAG: hypothetical protein JNL82_02330 [Myxococcales bacterium]|nr:hypothetical protein [Myxococcales bacterium]